MSCAWGLLLPEETLFSNSLKGIAYGLAGAWHSLIPLLCSL